MNVKWLIEPNVFGDEVQTLKEEIEKQGLEWKDIESCDFEKMIHEKYFDHEDCVVVYGSLDLAKKFQKNMHFNKYSVYIYCTMPNYECTKYYAYFGKYLLNQNYAMLPFSELKRRKDWLFDVFGKDGSLFVRPSSGAKIFTGQLIHKESFDKDYKLLGFYDVSDHATVVVSEPKDIIREWRLVISKDKIVAGTMYSNLTIEEFDYRTYTEDVGNYVQKILNETEYRPDPIWTMDICETKDGKIHLLEIGGFSCAGMYDCDMGSVVGEVSKISWEMHNG